MNNIFIKEFEKLVKQIDAQYLDAIVDDNKTEIIRHKYRLQSIKRVLDILKKLDFQITNVDQLKGIPGISKGSLRRIQEILDTSHLSELTNTSNKNILSIQELENVIGIGPAIAKKFITKYHIKSIDQLKKAVEDKKLKVSKIIQLGLKYYGLVQNNIPHDEITSIQKYLIHQAYLINPHLHLIIAGSYRRDKSTSNDVDVLLYKKSVKTKEEIKENNYLELFINELTKIKFLLDSINSDYHTKYMGFCQYKNHIIRIDIIFIPYESLASALLYFTGPYELNTMMRSIAKKKGMTLNEYGLFENGSRIDVKSESDIFHKLDMEYLPPDKRESFNTNSKKNF